MTAAKMLSISFVGVVLFGAAASRAEGSDGGAGGGGTRAVPACVQVATESRYVPYGYSHIVSIKNGCTRNVACTVFTDVNPEKQTVDVPAGTTRDVTTFLSSPSSTFVANVSCK